MKKLIILALVIVAALAADDKPADIPPQPNDNTTTSSTTTTTPTTPSTTTTKITTTTSKPTTTTTAPTTTKPTTPTTETTTTKVTTTAAPTPSTTPKPKPKEPEVLSFNVTENKNACIMMKMALMFKVPYETNKNGSHIADVMLLKGAVASGKCGNTSQIIKIQWNPEVNKTDFINFQFSKNDSTKDFMISSIDGQIEIDSINFPDAKSNQTLIFTHNKVEFNTPLKMSYKCNKNEYLNMSLPSNINETVATFIVSKLQMEAFRNSTSHDFSSAEDCEPFQTSGIVPIAVGCSLAALIIIVLVAYLIGRRRSQARGYLSM